MCVISLQEDLSNPTNCNGLIASNEDDAVKLMMYRQSTSAPTSGSQILEEPLPDELGPAERGEAPPLREVEMC